MSRPTPSSLSKMLYLETRIIHIGARTPELEAIGWEHLHRTRLQAGCEKHTFQSTGKLPSPLLYSAKSTSLDSSLKCAFSSVFSISIQ